MSTNFAEELRARRLVAQLSQEELAEAARISVSAVGAYEQGVRKSPHRQTVAMLADALGLDPHERAAFEAAARSTHRLGQRRRIASRSNLPAERAPFFGDERHVTSIANALRTNRLVTLTGTGGVGKSRSALRVAKRFIGQREAVWLVDVGALQRASTLSRSIAPALRSRNCLMILDNCEHLVAEVGQAVAAALQACPSLTVLATSRERLRIASEAVYTIPPLGIPASVALFVERAGLSQEVLASSRDREGIEEICVFLGGIPLAIELAASRVSTLGIRLLREQLENYLSVLSIGNRDLPQRQQTLRSALSWSYDLLAPHERLLYRRLGTLPEPFTAAEVFGACTGPDLSEMQIVNALASLVEKSIVGTDAGKENRYQLLPVARLFAIEKSIESGELTANIRALLTWALGAGASPPIAARAIAQLSLNWIDPAEKTQFLNWLGTALASIDVETLPSADLETCWRLLADGLDEIGQPLRASAARNCAIALAWQPTQ